MTATGSMLPCFRDEYLFRAGLTYLNHGSLGAVPRPVLERYHRYHLDLESDPIDFLDRRMPVLARDARAKAARYLGSSAANLVFIENVSVGVSQIFSSIVLDAGDELLITSHEYGAYRRVWDRLRARGIIVRIVDVPAPFPDREEITRLVLDSVRPNTRALFMSHIASSTSLIFPVTEIAAELRARGITSVIDGAHAVSQLDLDVEAIGADFYLGNFHKWLGAPRGSAFLHAREDRRVQVQPLIVSWGGELSTASGDAFTDDAAWTGTRDYAAYLTVPDAIEYQNERGWPAVRAECRSLARQAEAFLSQELAAKSLYSRPDESFGQMFSVELPIDAHALREELFTRHKIVVQASGWGGKNFMRVSIQCYNSWADIERLVECVHDIAGG